MSKGCRCTTLEPEVKLSYLDEIAQLRRNEENIGSEGQLAILLKPFIIHIDLLSRGVQRIIAAMIGEPLRKSYEIRTKTVALIFSTNLLWVNMCFMIRENRSEPAALQ